MKRLFLMICLALSASGLQSCSTIRKIAKDESKKFIEDYGKDIANSAYNTIKKWWETDGKAQLSEALAKIKNSTVEEAKKYIDEKLADNRMKIVSKLLADGYTIEEIDLDKDGKVSDDELAAFIKGHPFSLPSIGVLGLVFLALYYLSKKIKRG